MVSALISRVIILVFGNLYPAYASYKAIRNQNVKEYVKWMVYWIVFALFCCVETFSDIFLSWFPFYYEIKILFLLWLLSPLTKGSRFLFRKFVHPQLTKHGDSIDEYISQLRTKGYTAILKIGTTVISNATNLLINTAIKGKYKLADHVRRSYSMNDLNGERRAILEENIESEALHELSEDDEDQLDNRLREDNRELEKRRVVRRKSLEKKDKKESKESKEKRRPLQRSSSLERVAEDEEEEVIITEEIEYIPIKRGSRAYKELSSNPYGTIPRVRARQTQKKNR